MNIKLDKIHILPDALCRPDREFIRVEVDGLNYPYSVGAFKYERGFFLTRSLKDGKQNEGGEWEFNRAFFSENTGNKITHILNWIKNPNEAIELTRNFLEEKYLKNPVLTQNDDL